MIHDERNVGSETLRCVAFFSSAAILHTWEVPLMPLGSRGFVTPPPEAEGAEAAPVDAEAGVLHPGFSYAHTSLSFREDVLGNWASGITSTRRLPAFGSYKPLPRSDRG
jgi:hypothetical protein